MSTEDQPSGDSQRSSGEIHSADDSQSRSAQLCDDSQGIDGAEPTQSADDSQGPDGRAREVKDQGTSRVLSLGIDSAGGYAVPYQLDGTKRPKKRRP